MNNSDVGKHKVVLAIGPNGSRRGKADHPALPVTKDDIVSEAAAWRDAGASMLHLHVRDADGKHSLDPATYKDVIATLRSTIGRDMVLQITTESGGIFGRDVQMATVREVKPEAVSVALREIAPQDSQDGEFAEFVAWMLQERIAPQIILYDRADLTRLVALARAGTIDGSQLSVLYVLGRYSEDQTSKPIELLSFLGTNGLPFRDWMVCAFGANESRCAALAALLGGHVRVGFENNLYLPDGRVAPNNTVAIQATAAMLESLHAPLATSDDLRALWRIG